MTEFQNIQNHCKCKNMLMPIREYDQQLNRKKEEIHKFLRTESGSVPIADSLQEIEDYHDTEAVSPSPRTNASGHHAPIVDVYTPARTFFTFSSQHGNHTMATRRPRKAHCFSPRLAGVAADFLLAARPCSRGTAAVVSVRPPSLAWGRLPSAMAGRRLHNASQAEDYRNL
jgi:hypothetical protein